MFVPHANEIWKKNRTVETTRNYELVDKKKRFLKTILEDVSVAETIVYTKH